MASLAASRADGYYYPPDYDGEKHGSINKYNGSHPLGARARNLKKKKESKPNGTGDDKNDDDGGKGKGGFLVVRFEMPYNALCTGCGSLLAKGIRFNARKFRTGYYYSTPVYTFTMLTTCCCRELEIVADPEKCDYVIVKGAKKRSGQDYVDINVGGNGGGEGFGSAMEALERQKERANVEAKKKNPMAALERQNEDMSIAAQDHRRIESIRKLNEDVAHDDYSANKALRRAMRTQRKQQQADDLRAKQLNLPSHIRLLPQSDHDRDKAAFAMRMRKQGTTSRSMRQDTRKKIKTESIFGNQQGNHSMTQKDRARSRLLSSSHSSSSSSRHHLAPRVKVSKRRSNT